MIKKTLIPSIAMALSISATFASEEFNIEVIHSDFQKAASFKLEAVCIDGSIHIGDEVSINRTSKGSTWIKINTSPTDIKYLSTGLIFNNSKPETAVYKDYYLDNGSKMLALTIIPKSRDITFHPHILRKRNTPPY